MKRKSEEEYVQHIIDILKEKAEKDYESSHIRRSAHTKNLGLFKAHFKVNADLPKALKVGLFKTPGTYPALIRISSSMNKIQKDNRKDLRGFAIKILGVKGEKYLEDEKTTQDFILISTKTMPLGTVKLFHDAIYYTLKVNPVVFVFKMLFTGNIKKLLQVARARKHQSSPLDISYFSATPYQFGNKIVKYCIVPTSKYRSKLPDKFTPAYLVDHMKYHLNKNDATFDFLVQVKLEHMPVEDAAILWDESISPFIKVGEIIIKKQKFDLQSRKKLADSLSFNPAHCLVEHRPIGGLNRARTQIYQEMSRFRHEKNGESYIEPTLDDFDELI